ncbi:MAG: DNA polymerase III subunit beta [Alkaliphilus sp.]|nr:MAG: DNA polymerase III subunit beta [Alkaliphilus sp.]
MNPFGVSDKNINMIVEVCKKHTIEKIVIYGSRARGDYSRTSDIDIAIYADNLSSKDMNLLRYEISELDIIYKMDIVHVKTLEKHGLIEAIEKEGKVIFASNV